MRSIAVVSNHCYSGIIVMFVSQVQRFLKENQGGSGMALEEQGEMKGGSRWEAEDRPPCSAGDKKQREQSVEEGNPEAGGEDSQDTDGSTSVQAQQETEQPGRQLTCLEIPDFLRSDVVEGSTGNVLKKRNSSFGQSCFTPIMKRIRLCVSGKMGVCRKGKRRKRGRKTST